MTTSQETTTRRGRPAAVIELTDRERSDLHRWARRHTTAQNLALRAKIVLGCAEGKPNTAIAEELRCSPATVSKWRQRFATGRVGVLVDAPRSGRPPSVTIDQVEDVLIKTLEKPPSEEATHYSTRELAKVVGVGRETVRRVWKAFGLKPWVVDDFQLSPDPLFVEKLCDVVGLYLSPPVNAAVFSVDEKTQIQALDRTAPTLPILPHTPERATHSYVRHGTVDLFAALNCATGEIISDIGDTHNTTDFVAFLNTINHNVPNDLDVHLILDNLSTHKAPEVHQWLGRHPRFTLHFTATYASWMNLVERWFSALTTKLLQRSTHLSIEELTNDIQAWIDNWNQDPQPFKWHRTAEEILQRLGRYLNQLPPPE